MGMKTKIVVIRKKDLILYGAIIAATLILFALALSFFGGDSEESSDSVEETMTYNPGVYTSTVMLNDTAMDVEVVVDENNINSISLKTLDDSIETSFPLVKPAMEDLSQQIIKTQSVDAVTYSSDNQYTSMILHNAIKSALEKGKI